jgi:hypothetical protein
MGRPEGKRLLGRPRLDGKIILKWSFKTLDRSMDWIALAQESGKWQALGNAVINLRIS